MRGGIQKKASVSDRGVNTACRDMKGSFEDDEAGQYVGGKAIADDAK